MIITCLVTEISITYMIQPCNAPVSPKAILFAMECLSNPRISTRILTPYTTRTDSNIPAIVDAYLPIIATVSVEPRRAVFVPFSEQGLRGAIGSSTPDVNPFVALLNLRGSQSV